jgi:hypothetical protein
MAREGGMSRREFLLLAGAACCAGAAGAFGAEEAKPGARVMIENVDRFRVREPNFEGVRIVVDFFGEKYTPAYIQGISGAAFRIAGPCPCAPNCSTQMGTTDLLKLLGYEYIVSELEGEGGLEEAQGRMAALVPKIKDSIRVSRPALLWYAFADSAYEVVTGFDDGDGVFLGWHLHQGPSEGLAKATQTHAVECLGRFPALGAIFVGKRTGTLDARAAEIAALKEAVRHAHDREVTTGPGNPGPEGLRAYDGWVERFKQPEAERGAGDSHCHSVYRTTHRAAAGFLNEIAPRYPQAAEQLRAAATEFAAEADALDQAEPLIGWSSPEQDADRNAKLWPLLGKARDHYAAGIAQIEKALPRLAEA